jgi:hypothetical protein
MGGFSMMNTTLRWFARSSVVLTAATGLGGLTALAGDQHNQPRTPTHFRGLLNDFTPSAKVTKGGPYQMSGKWSLEVDERHGTARFEAAMNMETSDYAMTADTVDNPAVSRGAHTHHIVMTDGVIGTDWATACPVFNPVVKGGFVVRGTASVTGNGSAAPFGNPSPVTLCILGGDYVTFSNFTMAFGLPASGHFSAQAIHGVVLHCDGPWGFDSKECKVDLPE